MKKVIVLLILFAFCTQNNDQQKFVVKRIWVTDRIFETPESVIYDKQGNVIYVSNISGSPQAKDGNGFISKLNINGEIEKLKWIEGLDAPKGMGLFNGNLYVTDLDQIVEISIEQGKILKKYKSNKAQFLNDISIDNSGSVYVSDNIANIIFQLKDGKLESWLSSPELNGPNGLYVENDRLLVGNDGYLLSVNTQTKKITRFIENTDFIGLVNTYGLITEGHSWETTILGFNVL